MGKKKTRYERIIDDVTELGYQFKINDLDDMVQYSVSQRGDKSAWEPITKITKAAIRTNMRQLGYGIRGKKKPSLSEVEDAILTYANNNRYNPIRDYFNQLPLMAKYTPMPDGPYLVKNLASFFVNPDGMLPTWLFKWMVGAIAKVYIGARNPMLILTGPQQTGKSWFARWLCPLDEHFLRDSINPDDKDSHLRLTDHFLWEVEELGATTRRADVEALKAFITRDVVKKRPAYGEQLVKKPALCSFLGTVNFDGAGFLNDSTGSTRFLSCEVTSIDFAYSEIDVNQIWMECLYYYHNIPQAWELTSEQKRERDRINAGYEVPSALDDVINDLFIITCNPSDFLATGQIKSVVELHYKVTSEQMFHRELAKTLTKMGCEPGRTRYKNSEGQRRGWRGIIKRPDTQTVENDINSLSNRK